MRNLHFCLSLSIFDQFSNFFFLLKAYDFIAAFLVGAQNSLAQKTHEARTWCEKPSNSLQVPIEVIQFYFANLSIIEIIQVLPLL